MSNLLKRGLCALFYSSFAFLPIAYGDDGSSSVERQTPSISALRLLASTSIPAGTRFEGVPFGGISGIDRAADGTYWAISDDRGNEYPPRAYILGIDYQDNGSIEVEIRQQVNLLREDGSPYPIGAPAVDPEGIRVARNGNRYWSSEGNWAEDADGRAQPVVQEMTSQGRFVQRFQTPDVYDYVDNATRGGRNNGLFESLAVTPDGAVLVGNEVPLFQDRGADAAEDALVPLRITRLDPASGQPEAQYVHVLPEPRFGMTEMLAVSNREILAVERAVPFDPDIGTEVSIVKLRITPRTTDVLDQTSLSLPALSPMEREELLHMRFVYDGVKIDNIEAMAWGETLPNGHRTLLLVSDDNFNPGQVTQFLLFEVLP